MAKIYALLVGIDSYRLPALDLSGCVNDVEMAERLLRDRIAPSSLAIRTLRDEQATRGEIIRLFREHLGAAGVGDIALFWFSGHGSTAPLPEEIWYAESAGLCQTTVCHDSRDTAPDLYDRELAVLVNEVVSTGAQLVSIKDSCHARSGMRGDGAAGLKPRGVPSCEVPPPVRDLLPELVHRASDVTRPLAGLQVPGHVALSACDEWEVANEAPFPDGVQGVFSHALGQAIVRLGPDATNRQVLYDARRRVEGQFRRQVPVLEAVGDLADRIFLGGSLRPRATEVTLRCIGGVWEVDLAAVHGLVAGTRLAVHGREQLMEVRVDEVLANRSLVEPLGWSPDEGLQYEMVVTDVPLPPVAVSIQAGTDIVGLLTHSVQTAGPASGPSPHVHVVSRHEEPTSPLLLRVQAFDDRGQRIQLTSAGDEPLAPSVEANESGIAQTVQDLEHVARWLQVRNLSNPSPVLDKAVRIEVLPSPGHLGRPNREEAPLHQGDVDVAYNWNIATSAWEPPSVFIRLRNTTDRKLFCVLLDLTDQYRMHARLFPGEYVDRHWTADVGRGGPILLTLPPDRPVEPGASATDWLMLLVAEVPFSSDSFSLPRLRESPMQPGRSARRGVNGLMDRLGRVAVHRDIVPPTTVAADWAVEMRKITIHVPART